MLGRNVTRYATSQLYLQLEMCGGLRSFSAVSQPEIRRPLPCNAMALSADTPRLFSSKPSRKQGGKHNSMPLMNQKLVQVLLRKGSVQASELEVRLIVDKDGGASAESGVVSLVQAMEKSSELGVDLIGISLEQSPPVIKAQDYAKMAYKTEKKANKKGASGRAKPTKEFKFGAGIADNDMIRKAKDVLKYLSKGHNCQITATCSRRVASQNPKAIATVIQKVREHIGDDATDLRGVQTNKNATHASMLLQPSKGR